MLEYKITQKADYEIALALEYIKDELCNDDAAKKLYAKIIKKIDKICFSPTSYTVVSTSKHEYRRAMVGKHRLVYYVEDSVVKIARLYGPRQQIAE
jgi:plasmid stabilization system protein ParE